MKYFVTIGASTHEVDLVERLGELVVSVDGQPMDLSYAEADTHGQVVLLHDGKSYGISIEGGPSRVDITLAGHHYALELEDERERAAHLAARAAAKGGGTVTAVMPGVVAELLVELGSEVTAGQPLLILEAMKMQNEIAAPGDGVVTALHVIPGEAVAAGAKLVSLEGRE